MWIVIATVTAAVFVACGDTSSSTSSSSSATSKPAKRVEDIDMQATDFPNINTMTKIDGHFVTNLLGHDSEALKVARSKNGGKYPVGTLIQLVPQEAMVKRRAGFNRQTRDWEFFFLETSPQGTKIVTRGTNEVVNRFGGNCASCHLAADPKWDLVCEHTHGCAPLPIGDDLIATIQAADPRPR
ncbi:MAG: hypothetical protein ACXVKA_01645 [Acidimicrobiia bacterium]